MKSFEISLEGMQEVAKRLTAACKKGLEDEEAAIVKMFITYVHALPDKTEEGDFLALDLGGSNFRVLQLSQFAYISCLLCHVSDSSVFQVWREVARWLQNPKLLRWR